jgi:hypothetical protein
MIEQVEEQSTREMLVQPSSLTCAARSEKKKALSRGPLKQSVIHKSFYHVKKT